MQPASARRIALFDHFKVDLRSGELRHEGKAIRLGEQPFRILITLLERSGEVVTREELRKRLWPNDTLVEFEHSINAAVNRLRQLLGDSADEPRYIETLTRRGYRWKIPVTWSAHEVNVETACVQELKVNAASFLGKKISHYRVVEPLGAGGMGLVFKAEDLNLGRRVALKVLPEELSADSGALKRFEREARAASALDHPGICTIYDFGDHEGQPFIVMQLLQGQTVRDRLESGPPFSCAEALDIAIQISKGLEAAHEVGIIHRDIKPANIFLTNRGEAKILDFGLALLTEQGGSTIEADADKAVKAQHDTLTSTGRGMGTASYMSPEQIRGEKLDARTDLFSLGLVLYEMITGERAFPGETVDEVHDAIVHQSPRSIQIANTEVPAQLEGILNRALAKDRDARYPSAAHLGNTLTTVKRDWEADHEPTPLTRIGRMNYKRSASLLLLILSTIGSLAWWRSRPLRTPPMSVIPITSYLGQIGFPSLSPDGNEVAFMWNGGEDANWDLYVKLIGEPSALRLTKSVSGETIAGRPAWSPDGHRVAFIRCSGGVGSVFVMPASGGIERKVAEQRFCSGGLDWSPDGNLIAFSDKETASEPKGIYLASLETGDRHRLTMPPSSGFDFQPRFSPDSKLIAFVRARGVVVQDLFVVAVAGGNPRRLTFTDNYFLGLTWTRDGRELIFTNQIGENNTLWRIAIGGGTPERVPEVAAVNAFEPTMARQANRLAYTQNSSVTNIWEFRLLTSKESLSRAKKIIASTRSQDGPRFSPDGGRIAFVSDRSGAPQIWVSDKSGSDARQLTFLNGQHTGDPQWSPDGKFIVFASSSSAGSGIYLIGADRGTPQKLIADSHANGAPSMSHDGHWIYFVSDRSGEYQVWKMARDGGRLAQVTPHGGWFPSESMDGRFLYYVKGSFPTSTSTVGQLWRVPTSGGEERLVMDHIYTLDWTIGPEGIYFIDPETKPHPALKSLRFARSRVVTMAYLGGQPSCCNQELAVSHDGRHALWAQRDGESTDVMLVENFR